MMPLRFAVFCLGALLAAGCARNHQSNPPTFESRAPSQPGGLSSNGDASQKPIVTPDNALTGKVATVNGTARFVVLAFPPGHLPAIEQTLSLYRKGLKVGEVKVTGPQLDDNIVADLAVGDAQVGDEVRDK